MTDTAESPRRGRPPGVKQKERGMLRLDDETHARLVALADARGAPMMSVVRDALVAYLDAHGA